MIIQGNSIKIPLADNSVHSVITSPPYWALRDYGTASWIGGSGECDHKVRPTHNVASSTLGGGKQTTGHWQEGYKDTCSKCGATRIDNQIGLEPSMAAYIAVIVQVFREVKRVLHPAGVCFVNMGDSYSGGKNGRSAADTKAVGKDDRTFRDKPFSVTELPAKNLCMIPARVAIALQEDGWILRSEFPWVKGNPMPSSVQDRPGTAHEHVFMLVKSARYYYDGFAVRRKYGDSADRIKREYEKGMTKDLGTKLAKERNDAGGLVTSQLGARMHLVEQGRAFRTSDPFFDSLDAYIAHLQDIRDNGGMLLAEDGTPAALVVNTESFAGAHFACVDEETECLTASGWKNHSELRIGEAIAAYDMNTKSSKWTPLEDVATYWVTDEKMVKIAGRGINQLLTPNHRCLVRRESGRDVIVRADELKQSQSVLVATQWEKCGISFPERLARIIGWAVTEGYFGKDCVTIYQSGDAHPKYCEEIRQLLIDEGADYTEVQGKRMWRGREVIAVSWRIMGALAHEILSLCPQKKLPDDFLLWDTDTLQVLWDTLMKGDGHFREGGRQTYVQKDYISISQVQALATRLGYSTTLRKRSGETYSLYKTESTKRRLDSETTQLITADIYTGFVWCPKTKYGTFIARRGGYVFITGNTFPRKLVAPLVKVTPEKVCPKCNSPWQRVVEKEYPPTKRTPAPNKGHLGAFGEKAANMTRDGFIPNREAQVTTTGWRPTCKCIQKHAPNFGMKGEELLELADEVAKELAPIGGIILDPFCGSGTCGQVATEHGRRFIGIDLSAEYLQKNALPRSERLTSSASLAQLPMFSEAA